MFDPAVMGTLLIGLDAVRAEAREDRPRRSRRARGPRLVGVRIALAQGFRRAAALLDQPRLGDVTDHR
jgi:hypothetical protein